MLRPHNDDYKQIRVLGKGAYGEVWLVTNKENPDEQFALKKIPVKISDEGIPQSVIREVASLVALQRLKHPNVLRLHDAFIKRRDDQISLNILCEKCDWDLADFLQKIPHDMCNAQCKHFVSQIFCGIDFLHSNAIIHRDLKPQNILVNRDQTLRIADFGLSRNYGLHATFTTEVVTLWYRSPELLLQCKYNTSVDIWSAGCIFVELFTRTALFKAESEAQQLHVIFEKIGTPKANLWPQDAIVSRVSFPEYKPVHLTIFAPRLPTLALNLITQIFNFNP